MARGHGSLNKLIRQHDMSALTVIGILFLIGLGPLAILLMIFGFIGSFFDD